MTFSKYGIYCQVISIFHLQMVTNFLGQPVLDHFYTVHRPSSKYQTFIDKNDVKSCNAEIMHV